MQRSESIKEIAAAIAKAQGTIKNAAQDKTNPAFRSKYADLASVWEACRTQLAANGVAVVQSPEADGAKVTVTTLLAHLSGEWVESALTVTADKGTPQGIGSAITYARRYGLSAMVGVAPGDDIPDDGDDDGEAAEGRREAPRAHAAKQTPTAPPPAAHAAPKPVPPSVIKAWERLVEEKGGNKTLAKAAWAKAAEAVGAPKESSEWSGQHLAEVSDYLWPKDVP